MKTEKEIRKEIRLKTKEQKKKWIPTEHDLTQSYINALYWVLGGL